MKFGKGEELIDNSGTVSLKQQKAREGKQNRYVHQKASLAAVKSLLPQSNI
ncbi:hypothetical protein [Microcoleus sp. PH2017_22_RUC_O_B]|uniref:hypothetical protein n=1 Tax=Microcoleus sp. PH2017_22_RUC_O_B TaxID=2798833 RepID=UPI0025E9C162|nr:hypothetical protein [Microcoleus sp. PH2017_22_RUC_O_B]